MSVIAGASPAFDDGDHTFLYSGTKPLRALFIDV